MIVFFVPFYALRTWTSPKKRLERHALYTDIMNDDDDRVDITVDRETAPMVASTERYVLSIPYRLSCVEV
jgi:hypothetical protein